MIRVIVNGASGRMGKAIIRIAEEEGKISVIHKVDVTEGFENIDKISSDGVAVVVDISSPAGFRNALIWALKNGKPFISGTTGLEKSDLELLDNASKSIAVLHTSNLSKGVNILFEILRKAAEMTSDADIEIVEVHHNKKKDAPSGTALEIGKIILHEQKSRPADKIGYHSLRCGDVIGEHTAMFVFEGERIEITHRALTRDVLAKGAIDAALFLAGKKPGKYSMKDVIGLRS